MTEEQYKVLKKYEQQLTAAAKNNFLRLTHNEFNELAGVYDGLFRPLRQSQRNCNTCRLNALKSLYNAFIGEKMGREVKAQKEAEEAAKNAENKPQEETPTEKPVEKPKATNTNTPKATKTNKGTTNKKNAGRPKKIDIEG